MARRKWLVFGEGSQDVGRPVLMDEESPREGCVLELILKYLEECRGVPRDAMELEGRSLLSIRSQGGGWSGKVRRAMTVAEVEGFDAVVVVVDRDRVRGRLEELVEGRHLGHMAKLVVPTAVGCAVETLEAWLLADVRCLVARLRVREDRVPRAPEALAGHPGSAQHPKVVLRTLISESPLADEEPGKVYMELARSISAETLVGVCASGFGQFARELDVLLN